MSTHRLSDEQIRRAVFGNTMVGEVTDGSRYRAFVASDGTAHVVGTLQNGRSFDDRGRYVARDGMLCSSWRGFRQGAESCLPMLRNGDSYTTVNSNGATVMRFRIEPGNPGRS